jgi:hypothetical protein
MEYLTTITSLLSQYGAWGILAASVLVYTRQYWLPYIKVPSLKAPEVPSEDADVIDVAGLHLLQARAKRSGCPKFVAAVREVELCFFNHADAEPAK